MSAVLQSHPVFGASAIVDREDVIPAGLVSAGGEVIHLGMPVDPGNLMMLGNLLVCQLLVCRVVRDRPR